MRTVDPAVADPSPDESGRIRDGLRRAMHGGAWHGPGLLEALGRLTAGQAAARAIPGEHSAWEVALHGLGWTEEVARRVAEGSPALPARGDWPEAPSPADPAAWAATLDALREAAEALDWLLAALPEARLDEPIGEAIDPPLGTGVTIRAMLHGLAQHHAYHAGQVAILGRAAPR